MPMNIEGLAPCTLLYNKKKTFRIENICDCITIGSDAGVFLILIRQELSYRKQIARQLHTQYVEGTHRPKY